VCVYKRSSNPVHIKTITNKIQKIPLFESMGLGDKRQKHLNQWKGQSEQNFKPALKRLSEFGEYLTEPETIHERFEKDVAVVVDGGNGEVLSCVNGAMTVLREGKGNVGLLG